MLEIQRTFLPELKRLRLKSNSYIRPCIELLIEVLRPVSTRDHTDKTLLRLKKIEEDICNRRYVPLGEEDHYFCMRVFKGATERLLSEGLTLTEKTPIVHLRKAYQREENNKGLVKAFVEQSILQLRDEIENGIKVSVKNKVAVEMPY